MTYPHVDPDLEDPADVASNAELAPREYFGQVDVDCWFCGLVKGVGKEPYDSRKHERRFTAVHLTIAPLAEMRLQFVLEREPIAEGREWAGMVWPSAKALGVKAVRDLNGKWVRMQQVSTGRKYRNKAGEERESTTFKFLEMYPDEATCLAAYLAARGITAEDAETEPVEEPIPGFEDDNSATEKQERETALAFLKVLVKQHGGDPALLKANILNMPMIAKHFPFESEECQKLIKEVGNA